MATGAASSLARPLLRRLWADSAWAGVVFHLGGRDRAALEGLCAAARALGAEARPWVLDLSQPLSPSLPPTLAPPVRGLLFAAGHTEDHLLPRLEERSWDQALAVNLKAHARLLGALAAPGLLAPDASGLLVGSLAGARGREGQAAYAAAKGGLLDLLPLAPRGLRLNALLPPLLPSPLLDALDPGARARLFRDRLLEDPDPAASCAEAARFLLSDRASYIHRQAFHADSRVTALGWD